MIQTPPPDAPALIEPAPRWVAPVFALLGTATIPWTAYLAMTLPEQARTHSYREAWVGFDIMLLLALLFTAYLAWRGRRLVALLASSTATMLVLDAWFDITTSRRSDVTSAVVSAVLIELPLAIVCGWIALHADQVAQRRLRQLARRAARLQAQVPSVQVARAGVRTATAGSAMAEMGEQVANVTAKAAESQVGEAEKQTQE